MLQGAEETNLLSRMTLQAITEMAGPLADTDPYWRGMLHLCQVAQEYVDEVAAYKADIAELQAQYAAHKGQCEARLTAMEVRREQYEVLQDAHEALLLEHANLEAAYYLAQRALRRVQKDHGTDEHSPAEGD